MNIFLFRVGFNKKTFDEFHSEFEITAADYNSDATITKKDLYFSWLEDICHFWPRPTVPCLTSFDFSKPFSPGELYFALSRSDLYFEVETDYQGDLTKMVNDLPDQDANGNLIVY